MKSKQLNFLAASVILASAAPLTLPAQEPSAPSKTDQVAPAAPKIEAGSLTTTIQDSVTFATLAAALKASGLDVTLGQKGSFTIFAPTDEAFGKLPEGVLKKLMLPENKEKLRSLLLYHVVAGKVMSTDLKDGDVKTMNGEKVKIEVDEERIEVNDSKVFSQDVIANNGVMHSIGEVLVPKSLNGFAGLND